MEKGQNHVGIEQALKADMFHKGPFSAVAFGEVYVSYAKAPSMVIFDTFSSIYAMEPKTSLKVAGKYHYPEPSVLNLSPKERQRKFNSELTKKFQKGRLKK